uniref:Ethylmalonyl-CoA decarboxylase n=1 Tax=Oryzias melastigma TaxID=30732 RepID=A0A3B3C9N3_ORYME
MSEVCCEDSSIHTCIFLTFWGHGVAGAYPWLSGEGRGIQSLPHTCTHTCTPLTLESNQSNYEECFWSVGENPHMLPLISVALVEGKALGGGAELTTACDFRLMASGSVIQFVHKHMGLVPGWGGAARLVGIVGSRNALKLLGGAVKVDSELGVHVGLADGVLKVDQEAERAETGLQQAESWLSQYTKGPAPVIKAVKKVVLSGRELPLSEALRTEKDIFGTVWGGPANLQALANLLFDNNG